MKQRVIITMLIAAAMATAGCSKSDTPNIPDPSTPDSYVPSTTPIAFQTPYNWGDEEDTTRGVIKNGDFVDGDTFGVFAYYNAGGTSATEPNFMNNQKVTYDGTNWSYSPIKYWSNNSSDTFDFYAYSPHILDMSLHNDESGGAPYLIYQPSGDATEMVDLMTSAPVAISNDSDDKQITFNFKHQLAQIRFSMKHSGKPSTDVGMTGDKIKITEIQINGLNAYKCSFESDGSFKWTEEETAEATDCYTTISKGGLIDANIINGSENSDFILDTDGFYKLNTETGAIMLPPQILSNNSGNKLEIGVVFEYQASYYYETGATTTQSVSTDVVFDKIDIESGYIYNLRFELNPSDYKNIGVGKDIVREVWREAVDYDFGSKE